MLYPQHSYIDRGRSTTFLEELKAVAEVFFSALILALVGVALIAFF